MQVYIHKSGTVEIRNVPPSPDAMSSPQRKHQFDRLCFSLIELSTIEIPLILNISHLLQLVKRFPMMC